MQKTVEVEEDEEEVKETVLKSIKATSYKTAQ